MRVTGEVPPGLLDAGNFSRGSRVLASVGDTLPLPAAARAPQRRPRRTSLRNRFHVKATAIAALAAASSGCSSSSSDDRGGERPQLAAFNAVADMRTITSEADCAVDLAEA